MISASGTRADGSACQYATGAVYSDRSHVLAAIAMIEGDEEVVGLVASLESGNKVEAKQATASIRLLELPELKIDGKDGLSYSSLSKALRKGDGRVRVLDGKKLRYVIWEMAVNGWPAVGEDAIGNGRWYDDPDRWEAVGTD
jgi:hypothetical protein